MMLYGQMMSSSLDGLNGFSAKRVLAIGRRHKDMGRHTELSQMYFINILAHIQIPVPPCRRPNRSEGLMSFLTHPLAHPFNPIQRDVHI